MVKFIINSSDTERTREMAKQISELLYRVNPSILRYLINYKNDLLALEDILKELDKELKQIFIYGSKIRSKYELQKRVHQMWIYLVTL